MTKRKIYKPNVKLRQARELRGWSQQKLAREIGTSESLISRWEGGEHTPGKFYQDKQCILFDKNAEELGFIESTKPAPQPSNTVEETIKKAIVEGIIEAFNLLGGLDMNKERRTMLISTLGLMGAGSILPFVGGAQTMESGNLEENIFRWESCIDTFWDLYFSGGIPVIEECLPNLLTQLSSRANQTSTYQNQIASLTVQACQISWLLNLQRQDFGTALKAIQLAHIYADITKDPDLTLSSLIREAHTHYHLNNPIKQLLIHEQGLEIADKASPLVRSWLFILLAENHAHLHHTKKAEEFLDLAKKTLPPHPEQFPSFSYVRMNEFLIANFEVISHLHLQRPHKALTILSHFDLSTPDPRCSELLNHRLKALYVLGNMNQMCREFEIAVQTAKRTKSDLRYNEVCGVYCKMIDTWPKEQKVQELQTLFR